MPVSPLFFLPSVWLSTAGVAHFAPSQKPDLQSLSSSQASPSLQVGTAVPTPQGLPAGGAHALPVQLPLPHSTLLMQTAPVHLPGQMPPQSSPSSPSSFRPLLQLGPGAS